MYPFNLRGEKLSVRHAQLYENSGWDAEKVGEITDDEIVVQGVMLAKRRRNSRAPEPYVFIDELKNARYPEDVVIKPSGRGFWLREVDRTPTEAD